MSVFAPKGPFPQFPGWRYGPDGTRKLFQTAEDMPEGWTRQRKGLSLADIQQASEPAVRKPMTLKRPAP